MLAGTRAASSPPPRCWPSAGPSTLPSGCCATTPTWMSARHLAIVGEDPPLLTAREIPTLVDNRGAFPLSYRSVVLRGLSGRLDPGRRPAGIPRATGADTSAGVRCRIWTPTSMFTCGRRSRRRSSNSRPTPHPGGPPPRSHRLLPVGFGVNALASGCAASSVARSGDHRPYTGLDEAGSFDQARFERADSALDANGGRDTMNRRDQYPSRRARRPRARRFDWGYRWADELAMLWAPAPEQRMKRPGGSSGWRTVSGAAARGQTLSRPADRRRAGRAGAYRPLPMGARLHATIRWWSAPFPAVEAEVPRPVGSWRSAAVTGCLHLPGAVTARGGARGGHRRGQDRPGAGVARSCPAGPRFDVAASGAVAAGPWDAIVIVDMLYLLPAAAARLLAAAGRTGARRGAADQGDERDTALEGALESVQETLSVSFWASRNGGGAPGGEESEGGSVGGRRFDFVDPAPRRAGCGLGRPLQPSARSAPAAPANHCSWGARRRRDLLRLQPNGAQPRTKCSCWLAEASSSCGLGEAARRSHFGGAQRRAISWTTAAPRVCGPGSGAVTAVPGL